ncbi:hypothetical protein PCE1_000293 [Barthelona sp. PCE]
MSQPTRQDISQWRDLSSAPLLDLSKTPLQSHNKKLQKNTHSTLQRIQSNAKRFSDMKEEKKHGFSPFISGTHSKSSRKVLPSGQYSTLKGQKWGSPRARTHLTEVSPQLNAQKSPFDVLFESNDLKNASIKDFKQALELSKYESRPLSSRRRTIPTATEVALANVQFDDDIAEVLGTSNGVTPQRSLKELVGIPGQESVEVHTATTIEIDGELKWDDLDTELMSSQASVATGGLADVESTPSLDSPFSNTMTPQESFVELQSNGMESTQNKRNQLIDIINNEMSGKQVDFFLRLIDSVGNTFDPTLSVELSIASHLKKEKEPPAFIPLIQPIDDTDVMTEAIDTDAMNDIVQSVEGIKGKQDMSIIEIDIYLTDTAIDLKDKNVGIQKIAFNTTKIPAGWITVSNSKAPLPRSKFCDLFNLTEDDDLWMCPCTCLPISLHVEVPNNLLGTGAQLVIIGCENKIDVGCSVFLNHDVVLDNGIIPREFPYISVLDLNAAQPRQDDLSQSASTLRQSLTNIPSRFDERPPDSAVDKKVVQGYDTFREVQKHIEYSLEEDLGLQTDNSEAETVVLDPGHAESMAQKLEEETPIEASPMLAPSQPPALEPPMEEDVSSSIMKSIEFRKSQAGTIVLERQRCDSALDIDRYEQNIEDEFERLMNTMDVTDRAVAIPEKPRGRVLRFELMTSWGDPHWVGLTSLQIFGFPFVETAPISVQCNVSHPLSNGTGAFAVHSLFDGVHITSAEQNMFLAPFTLEDPVIITCDLPAKCTLGAIRFWNYNKNRMDADKGARLIKMFLDDVPVFQGEIGVASGDLSQQHEDILFVSSTSYQERLQENVAKIYNALQLSKPPTPRKIMRPSTGVETVFNEDEFTDTVEVISDAVELISEPVVEHVTDTITEHVEQRISAGVVHAPDVVFQVLTTNTVTINILSTWGATDYVGMNCIELYNTDGPVAIGAVLCEPHSVNCLQGNFDPDAETFSDDRIPERLIDNSIDTAWLAPIFHNTNVTVNVLLEKDCDIVGMRFWNYSKPGFQYTESDDPFNTCDWDRGVRDFQIVVNGDIVVSAVMSPSLDFMTGNSMRISSSFFHFAAEDTRKKFNARNMVMKSRGANEPSPITQLQYQWYFAPLDPFCSFIRLDLIDTHGDSFYIGLNAIELYGVGGKITINPNQMYCSTGSVGSQGDDARVLGNLVKETNEEPLMRQPHNVWLSRREEGTPTTIIMMLPRRQQLTHMVLHNYTREPQTRGVREFFLFIDNFLSFQGTLGIGSSRCILFTLNPQVKFRSEMINRNHQEEKNQPVLLVNEGVILNPNIISNMTGGVRPDTCVLPISK